MGALITGPGFELLQRKLERMKNEIRPQVARSLEEARSRGDLSENSEFNAAREKLWEIDRQIGELESLLADVQVVELPDSVPEAIQFGVTAKLLNLTRGREETYHIVGAGESDGARGRISYLTPLAQALIGRKKGEEIEAKVPAGTISFRVLDILPLDPRILQE